MYIFFAQYASSQETPPRADGTDQKMYQKCSSNSRVCVKIRRHPSRGDISDQIFSPGLVIAHDAHFWYRNSQFFVQKSESFTAQERVRNTSEAHFFQ